MIYLHIYIDILNENRETFKSIKYFSNYPCQGQKLWSLHDSETLSYPLASASASSRVRRSSVKRENSPYTEDLPKSNHLKQVK